jgi:glycosyltransferase involved in cell wall biosynthesis
MEGPNMSKKSILILTHRNLDAGGGASYRTVYIAKYLSNFFRVFIVDAQRNTYIVVDSGFLRRRTQQGSILCALLNLVPSILDRLLLILKFPKEEVGRFTSIMDFGIFYDALRIGLRVKPFLIMVEEYYSLTKIASLLRKIVKAKYLVLDLHNVDTLRLSRYPSVNKMFVKLIYLLEKRACSVANLVTVVSNSDLYLAKKLFGIDHVILLSNFVNCNELENAKHKGLECLKGIMPRSYVVFHGDFRYFPNREALFILVNQVMAKIWKHFPDIKLVVMGPGLPRISRGRLVLMGYVPQKVLYEVLCNASCAIVPLLRGGGTRIKILEYMACGIPVISTKIAAEGLEVKNFEHILPVNSVDEIPSMFELLMKNDKLREKIRCNAIALVKERYDIAKAMKRFIDICFQWAGSAGDEHEARS